MDEFIEREKLRALYECAEGDLSDLCLDAIEGSLFAIRHIHAIAVEAVSQLEGMAFMYPDIVRELAANSLDWPILLPAKHAARTKPSDELMDAALEVGANLDLNLGKGKAFDETLPANKAALDFWRMISVLKSDPTYDFNSEFIPNPFPLSSMWYEQARKLPPLNKETVRNWREIIQPYLLFRYGKNIEEHRDFQDWKSRPQHTKSGTANRGQNKEAPCHRRADIRKAIMQALRTIASDK